MLEATHLLLTSRKSRPYGLYILWIYSISFSENIIARESPLEGLKPDKSLWSRWESMKNRFRMRLWTTLSRKPRVIHKKNAGDKDGQMVTWLISLGLVPTWTCLTIFQDLVTKNWGKSLLRATGLQRWDGWSRLVTVTPSVFLRGVAWLSSWY